MNKKKNDIILISGLVLAAVLFLLFQRAGKSSGSNSRLIVTVDNEAVLKGMIYEDTDSIIKNADYINSEYISAEDNRLIIKNGEAYNTLSVEADKDGSLGVRCIEANCRDHVCMDTGLTVSEENPIICLPHKLAVRVVRTE